MAREINDVEDVLADESFQSWYFREDNEKAEDWAAWIDEHPDKFTLTEQAVQIMQAMPVEKQVDPAVTGQALQALRMRMNSASFKPRVLRMRWWRVAASVAAALLIGFWAYRQYNIRYPEKEWQTAYGQIKPVQLPDGSEILLNANSRLKGKNIRNGRQDRELWLDGEAYFHIKPNGNGQRMIVHTSNGDVLVTGTAFNIRNRDGVSKVLLTEGAVLLRSPNGTELPLSPGELATWKEGTAIKLAADTAKLLAWKRQVIVFNKTKVEEFAAIVEEYYGKKVTILGTETAPGSINGVISNENLDNLLKAVTMITDWKLQYREDTIVIVVN